jgi:transposase
MRQKTQQDQNNKRILRSQQVVIPLDLAVQIPEDAPVRLLGEILDRMDFGCLERAEKRGVQRKIPGRILFGVLVYGEMKGMYSSRKIEECCRYDVRYRWLLEGCAAPDHSTISRFRGEVLPEVAEELFGQLMGQLAEINELDYAHLFVDGTKQEANANRYSFVWRKSVERRLVKLREKAAALLTAEGAVELDTVRQALLAQEDLCRERGTQFVSGKGKRKSPEQRHCEALGEIVAKWKEYEDHLSIIGNSRNSYSKTDHDATFMRMKDDHMRNAQLKPGYNVQIGVSSEYIVGIEAFPNRSDSGTFVPFLNSIEQLHGRKFKSVTGDAGYESLENYLYLEENQQLCFIKPANYQSSKKKNKNWVGRREDMDYCPVQDVFFCQGGMALWPVGTRTRKSETGFSSTATVYRCENCAGCPLRSKCTRAKDGKNKQLEVNHQFARLRENSLKNITAPIGVQLRVNRSIMVEGAFGVIKEDYGFRRFLLRGKRKIQTELFLLAFAFNIRKLHARMHSKRAGSQLFEVRIA